MSEFISEFKKNIFNITKTNFENAALQLFHYQREHNEVYKKFISLLSINPEKIKSADQIPFLPVDFFKYSPIVSTHKPYEILFESSGTTGVQTSKHYISDLKFYNTISKFGFEQFFGNLDEFVVLALLPSYLERNNSSLVYMVKEFITLSNHVDSAFYLDDFKALKSTLKKYINTSQKVLLIGVSFALLDFSETIDFNLTSNIVVMETGGMKGRRKEMLREELHQCLQKQLGTSTIYSEYGMTELMSQAYLLPGSSFYLPHWMKVYVRKIDDPFLIDSIGKGVLNIIDLANIDSCAFLALQDLGEIYADGTFQVLGRVDNSDIRGCNLMYL